MNRSRSENIPKGDNSELQMLVKYMLFISTTKSFHLKFETMQMFPKYSWVKEMVLNTVLETI